MFRDLMTTQFQDTTVQRWLLAVGVACAIFLVLRIISSLVIKQLRDVVNKTPALWDDLVFAAARRTSWVFQLTVGLAVARMMVELPPVWARRSHAGFLVVLVIQMGVWATGFVDFMLLAHMDKRKIGSEGESAYQTGRNMLRFILLIVVWAVVLLLTLENVGINVSTLVAGLGVTGVAVAFATQNVLGDLFASVSLLLDKPFLVGDVIVVDTFVGTVERIGIRTTRVRSLSGESLIFANSDLAKSRLRNYKTQRERRVVFNFSLRYDTPAEQIEAAGGVVRQVVAAQPKARFDRAHWLTFGEKGLVFECVYYVISGDYTLYMDIQQAINLGILRAMRERNVLFAYGTQLTALPTQMTLPMGSVPSAPN